MSKFDSPRDEVLFTIGFDSMWNDDHMGNTDSPTGYFAKLDLNRDDALAILADSQIKDLEVLPTVDELIGQFLITEDSSGFVYVTEYEDIPALRDAYDELEADYNEWDSEDEDDAPASYRDNVDGHWYVCRYDRTLPQIHASDCETCSK